MQFPPSIPAPGPRTDHLPLIAKPFAATVLVRLLHWHELARQRRALLALDHRMLKDVGISRAEAEREARRSFWRAGITL